MRALTVHANPNKTEMKKTTIIIAAAAALLMGCAKEKPEVPNEDELLYFRSWMQKNHPDLQNRNGIYVMEDIPGDGAAVKDLKYLFVTYTYTDLKGNVLGTSDIEVSKRIGTYSKSSYYGPVVWYTAENSLSAGMEEAVSDMKVGGTRKVIIPGWMFTYSRYETEQEYIDNVTGNDNTIYTIHISDATDDITAWECARMKEFSDKYLGGIDTVSTGFYYKSLSPAISEEEFASDTTITINYTGRLLNGQVFDTTIPDTAKVYNIYSSANTYGTASVAWSSTADGLQLTTAGSSSGSSVISGFSKTLWEMKNGEKGVGMFYSSLGYGTGGSGSSIPGYAPLIFEIEIITSTEEEE